MRFKRGSRVEVLNKREVPSGSWWCAEILSGNGHNYNVRYDRSLGTGEKIVEIVSRKVIRPCPPPSEGATDYWVPGHIVEVFDNHSWKIAEVLRVVNRNYFYVRLLGSSQEFRVYKSDLRVRLYWQNNEWVVIGKESGYCTDGKMDKLSKARYHQKLNYQVKQPKMGVKNGVGDDGLPIESNIGFQEHRRVYSRTMKRKSPFYSSHIESEIYNDVSRKKRTTEKEARHRQLIPGHQSPLLEKVDAVASPRTMLGEKYMHASFNNRTTGYSGIVMESGKSNDVESSECSVASCSSASRGPYKLPYHSRTGPSQVMDGHCDDAESFCGYEYGRKCFSISKEELAAEIHKLELHAYCSTMEALYASGPLSWEQEALVTNLRLTLHISNDEHLMELRHLVSSEMDLPIH